MDPNGSMRAFIKDFVAEHAPEETAFVDPVLDAYERTTTATGGKTTRAGLGFGGAEAAAFITPILIEAISTTIKVVIEKAFDRKARKIDEKKVRQAVLDCTRDLKPALRDRLAERLVVYLKEHPEVLSTK